MASTSQQASRSTIWIFRSLAIGSSVAVVIHLYPTVKQAYGVNALKLTNSENVHYAKTGVGRLGRIAQRDTDRAKELVQEGALVGLARAARRNDDGLSKEAFKALVSFAGALPNAKEHLSVGAVAALLAGDETCAADCRTLWKALGVERPDDRARRIALLKEVVNEEKSRREKEDMTDT